MQIKRQKKINASALAFIFFCLLSICVVGNYENLTDLTVNDKYDMCE